MTVNLEELDALHVAASAGPWEAVTDDDANDEVRLVEAAPRRHARGGGRIVPVLMMTPKADAECIVALHTAYPAMSVELRRLRTENTDLREELAHVLADWSALREAIGSPTNGGAIGWATQLRKTAHDVVALAESRRHGVWIPASAFSGLSKIVGESRIKDDDYP